MCHPSQVDSFVEACGVAIQELYGDDPTKSDFYGRIINKTHHKRITDLLESQNMVKGCKIAIGGKVDVGDLYIAPTVITGVGKDNLKNCIMKGEIFGPILPVVCVSSVQEAISFVNSQ